MTYQLTADERTEVRTTVRHMTWVMGLDPLIKAQMADGLAERYRTGLDAARFAPDARARIAAAIESVRDRGRIYLPSDPHHRHLPAGL